MGIRDRLRNTESGRDVLSLMVSSRMIQKVREFFGYRKEDDKEAEERAYMERQIRDFYRWRGRDRR